MKTRLDGIVELPDALAYLFWDHDWESVSWEKHSSFIIQRILQAGDWESICWLRRQIGDQAVRSWLEEHEGGGLSSRQLHFWGLILSLQKEDITHWIHKNQSLPWTKRMEL